ncbi:MAG: HAD family phosphatase [Pseudomonadota bacterium]
MAIKAVLFDMDGLLLDTERLAYDAFRTAAAAWHEPVPDAAFFEVLGRARRDGEARFRALLPEVDHDGFARTWDATYTQSLAEAVPLRPRVREVLERITLPMAVVTSSRRAFAEDKLGRTGLLDFFAHLVCGDEVGQAKPHPEPYLTGAAGFGLAAEDCAAFEDSEPGTRAALAAGCLTVQVPDLVPPSDTLRARGHVIAPDLRAGAEAIGLI